MVTLSDAGAETLRVNRAFGEKPTLFVLFSQMFSNDDSENKDEKNGEDKLVRIFDSL